MYYAGYNHLARADYSRRKNKFSKWRPRILCIFSFFHGYFCLSDNQPSDFTKTVIRRRLSEYLRGESQIRLGEYSPDIHFAFGEYLLNICIKQPVFAGKMEIIDLEKRRK